MKHHVAWLSFPLLLLLTACPPDPSPNPNPEPPDSVSQKLDTRYARVGKPMTIDLNWALEKPVVQISGRKFDVQQNGQSLILTLPERPNTWGGPQDLVIQDGKNKAVGTLNVLGKLNPEEPAPTQIELVTAKISGSARQEVIDKIQKTVMELGGKATVKAISLDDGPGACGGYLIDVTITEGDFEKILTKLDELAKEEANLLGINPATTWGLDVSNYGGIQQLPSITINGAESIDAPSANKRGFTGEGMVVAVFDTGVSDVGNSPVEDKVQYEFGSRLLPGQSFTKAGQSANAKDNYGGAPAVRQAVPPKNKGVGHGTQVASLIAGNKYGVAPKAKILPIKVCGRDGKCRTGDILRGVCWAMKNQEKNLDKLVFNLSIGSDTGGFEQDSIALVLKSAIAQGVNVVASAGNQWKDFTKQQGIAYPPKSYPAALSVEPHIPEMIAVGSVHQVTMAEGDELKMANYSNRGQYVDLSAPGLVYAVDRLGFDRTSNVGTSFAAPLAAGAVALWKQKLPNAKPKDIKEKILNSAGSIKLDAIDQPLVTNRLLDLRKEP